MSLTTEQIAAMPWPTTYDECFKAEYNNRAFLGLYSALKAGDGIDYLNPHACFFEGPNPTWAQDIVAAYATYLCDKGFDENRAATWMLHFVCYDNLFERYHSDDIIYDIFSAFGIETIEQLRAVFPQEQESKITPEPLAYITLGRPRWGMDSSHKIKQGQYGSFCSVCGITRIVWQRLSQPACNAHRIMLATQERESERCAEGDHKWEQMHNSDPPNERLQEWQCEVCDERTGDFERVEPFTVVPARVKP